MCVCFFSLVQGEFTDKENPIINSELDVELAWAQCRPKSEFRLNSGPDTAALTVLSEDPFFQCLTGMERKFYLQYEAMHPNGAWQLDQDTWLSDFLRHSVRPVARDLALMVRARASNVLRAGPVQNNV